MGFRSTIVIRPRIVSAIKKETSEAIEFFLSDTRVLAWSKKFSIAGITENIIHRSIDYVREFNLKTSDVTHLVTAKATAFHLIMIDDKNFQCFKQVQDIGLLQITHPSLEFKKRINKYLS